jgi:hypothetical protein
LPHQAPKLHCFNFQNKVASLLTKDTSLGTKYASSGTKDASSGTKVVLLGTKVWSPTLAVKTQFLHRGVRAWVVASMRRRRWTKVVSSCTKVTLFQIKIVFLLTTPF